MSDEQGSVTVDMDDVRDPFLPDIGKCDQDLDKPPIAERLVDMS